MGMSDLVKRLRDLYQVDGTCVEAADRIEQLERELSEWKASQSYRYIGIDGKPVLARVLEDRAIKAEAELAAEKALADRFGLAMQVSNSELQAALLAWRKARGL